MSLWIAVVNLDSAASSTLAMSLTVFWAPFLHPVLYVLVSYKSSIDASHEFELNGTIMNCLSGCVTIQHYKE